MKITQEEAFEILYDDDPNWIKVQEEITYHGRWSLDKFGVFQHIPTGKFYGMDWAVPATERQEVETFGYNEEVTLTEVKPVERTVVVYEAV